MARQRGLRAAIAEQAAPLISWWEEWRDDEGAASFLLDFWGRGGFARVAAAVRAKPRDAIAVDVRTTDEIARWARILCPLFETVVVKWKGYLGRGLVVGPRRDDQGSPGTFGGWGYIAALDELRENWHAVVGHANPVPIPVARFLAGDALPLVASGRLVVLPAPLVGCTQSAVGWTDNLLVDGFLNGIVNVVSGAGTPSPSKGGHEAQRVLDLSAISIPYIDDIGLQDLAAVLEETQEYVPALKSLLLKSIASDDLRHERWQSISALENDILDACRELRSRLERLAPTGGWHIGDAPGSLSAGSRGGDVPAHEPVTDLLRSVASARRDLAPWIPFWRLRDFGGRLDWSSPLDNPSKPSSREGDPAELHSWIYPGSAGVRVMPVAVIVGPPATENRGQIEE